MSRIVKRVSTRRLGIPGLSRTSRIKAAFEGSDDGYSFFFVNEFYYAKLDGSRSRTIVGNSEEFVHCCGATKAVRKRVINVFKSIFSTMRTAKKCKKDEVARTASVTAHRMIILDLH